MGPKKARISSEEAIQNILRFIEEDNVDEAMDEELDDEDDLEELCGEIGNIYSYIIYTYI